MTLLSSQRNPGAELEQLMQSKNIIAASVIPVAIFGILLIHNERSFTVNDMITGFDQLYKIKLRFVRMQQILDDMVMAGMVKRHQARNSKNNVVSYYSFKTIL